MALMEGRTNMPSDRAYIGMKFIGEGRGEKEGERKRQRDNDWPPQRNGRKRDRE